MNRRDFLKTSIIAGVATLITPAILSAEPPVPALPPISWKDFDWMQFPSELAFRVEVKNGKDSIVSTPYLCRAQKTKLVCFDEGPDIAQEKEKVFYRYCVQYGNETICIGHEEIEVYTNPILLHEAKKLGFTHIYMFAKGPYIIEPVQYRKQYSYFIRGAKLPDWKTDHGKLKIVTV